jgi:hypothetical protein
MELEIDIDKMFPDDDQLENTTSHNPEMEIIGTIPWTKKSLLHFRMFLLTMNPENWLLKIEM